MDLFEQLTLTLGVLQLIATIAIAVTVRNSSIRLAKLQTERDLRTAWMGLDQWVMEDEGRLQAVDLLHPEDVELDVQGRRHRWLCYLLRNPLEFAEMSCRERVVVDEKATRESIEASLRPLVMDEIFWSLVNTYTDDSAFKALCRRLRQEQQRRPPRAFGP